MVPWDESVWLVDELLTDPSSHLLADALDWAYPVSREWIILADTLDLAATVADKRNKPLKRPWSPSARRRRPAPIDPELKAILMRNAGRG